MVPLPRRLAALTASQHVLFHGGSDEHVSYGLGCLLRHACLSAHSLILSLQVLNDVSVANRTSNLQEKVNFKLQCIAYFALPFAVD